MRYQAIAEVLKSSGRQPAHFPDQDFQRVGLLQKPRAGGDVVRSWAALSGSNDAYSRVRTTTTNSRMDAASTSAAAKATGWSRWPVAHTRSGLNWCKPS
jgi:hypothetical protein